MRVHTLFKKLIGIAKLVVEGFRMDQHGLVFRVRGAHVAETVALRPRSYDRRPTRLWRHLTVGAIKLWLEYAPRRVHCRRCGVRNE
jgi:transposase